MTTKRQHKISFPYPTSNNYAVNTIINDYEEAHPFTPFPCPTSNNYAVVSMMDDCKEAPDLFRFPCPA